MDIADTAGEYIDQIDAAAIQFTRSKVAAMPEGSPGDCDLCGEWSGRLVNGACAPCRDRHRLP